MNAMVLITSSGNVLCADISSLLFLEENPVAVPTAWTVNFLRARDKFRYLDSFSQIVFHKSYSSLSWKELVTLEINLNTRLRHSRDQEESVLYLELLRTLNAEVGVVG